MLQLLLLYVHIRIPSGILRKYISNTLGEDAYSWTSDKQLNTYSIMWIELQDTW